MPDDLDETIRISAKWSAKTASAAAGGPGVDPGRGVLVVGMILQVLRAEHPRPFVVQYAPEAGPTFDAFAARVDGELGRDKQEAYLLRARAEEKAGRLALVYGWTANREQQMIDEPAAR
jgi:hypothetical protein